MNSEEGNVDIIFVNSFHAMYAFSYCPYRSSPSMVFLGKGVLKICSEFTEEHPCRSAISIKVSKCNFNKVACNFTQIALRHGCSPINLLYIFRTPFPKNTSGGMIFSLK